MSSFNGTGVSASAQRVLEAPVKIVLSRRPKPGAREPFEAWVKELLALAARTAVVEGSSVLTASDGECFILLRFADARAQARFESSPLVHEHLSRGEALATASDDVQRSSGLETWFTLPGTAARAAAPPRWKMALVTWLALMPQVIALGFVIPASVPFLAKVALSTAIPVCLLTWVVMPALTVWLRGWLFASEAPRSSTSRAAA